MESIGFKEWAAVCEALGLGRQSIILRKGGIAEGREGFSFKHAEFFLFPTWFHEQPQKVREWSGLYSASATGDLSAGISTKEERRTSHAERLIEKIDFASEHSGLVEIRYAARVQSAATINSWETAQALMPLHILQPEVVRERFDYDEAPGLHVAFVRVYRLDPSWTFPNNKRYGGCRSWVKLPQPPNGLELEPVLTDSEYETKKQHFLEVLSCTPAS
jgi:hypothetical protein